MVNYPYDDDKKGLTEYSKSPDDMVFRQVSKAYSQVSGFSQLVQMIQNAVRSQVGFMHAFQPETLAGIPEH